MDHDVEPKNSSRCRAQVAPISVPARSLFKVKRTLGVTPSRCNSGSGRLLGCVAEQPRHGPSPLNQAGMDGESVGGFVGSTFQGCQDGY